MVGSPRPSLSLSAQEAVSFVSLGHRSGKESPCKPRAESASQSSL